MSWIGMTTPLANDYSLNTPDINTTFNAPLTNKPYLKISGDFNPIHVNPYFSDFASLPATITHQVPLMRLNAAGCEQTTTNAKWF